MVVAVGVPATTEGRRPRPALIVLPRLCLLYFGTRVCVRASTYIWPRLSARVAGIIAAGRDAGTNGFLRRSSLPSLLPLHPLSDSRPRLSIDIGRFGRRRFKKLKFWWDPWSGEVEHLSSLFEKRRKRSLIPIAVWRFRKEDLVNFGGLVGRSSIKLKILMDLSSCRLWRLSTKIAFKEGESG